jgi:hypothetical protein
MKHAHGLISFRFVETSMRAAAPIGRIVRVTL